MSRTAPTEESPMYKPPKRRSIFSFSKTQNKTPSKEAVVEGEITKESRKSMFSFGSKRKSSSGASAPSTPAPSAPPTPAKPIQPSSEVTSKATPAPTKAAPAPTPKEEEAQLQKAVSELARMASAAMDSAAVAVGLPIDPPIEAPTPPARATRKAPPQDLAASAAVYEKVLAANAVEAPKNSIVAAPWWDAPITCVKVVCARAICLPVDTK